LISGSAKNKYKAKGRFLTAENLSLLNSGTIRPR
jgi:hypothetical protein